MAEPAQSQLVMFMGSLSRAGFPNSDLWLVDDLGKHAARKAMDSAELVAATAPPGLRSAVMLNAMLRLLEASNGMMDAAAKAARERKDKTK